ncbi:MAG: M24 family metallopeptidase [Nanoarchaeota archaeon]|nr:M24 family metallopeptidase [Nanoarchaeota archaeon]
MKLKYVKKACQATDQIFNKLIKNFHFKTEIEVADFILNEIKKKSLKPAFPMIVASERNHHHIHHYPKKHKLSGFTIIDFGVKYKGFCSDMTRTLFIGKPKKQDLKLYNLVLKTQQNCLKRIKIGQPYKDLDIYARTQLQPYQKYFKHTLGHGLGRKIHQKPKISPHSKDKAKFGDIITIEPGLYKKNNFGIRIEDTVYLGKKTQILTKSPRKLFIFSKRK